MVAASIQISGMDSSRQTLVLCMGCEEEEEDSGLEDGFPRDDRSGSSVDGCNDDDDDDDDDDVVMQSIFSLLI